MLRYKGGMRVTNIQVRGVRKILMFRERTLGKNPSWDQRSQDEEAKCYRACI
jgi:hypothetical protein